MRRYDISVVRARAVERDGKDKRWELRKSIRAAVQGRVGLPSTRKPTIPSDELIADPRDLKTSTSASSISARDRHVPIARASARRSKPTAEEAREAVEKTNDPAAYLREMGTTGLTARARCASPSGSSRARLIYQARQQPDRPRGDLKLLENAGRDSRRSRAGQLGEDEDRTTGPRGASKTSSAASRRSARSTKTSSA